MAAPDLLGRLESAIGGWSEETSDYDLGNDPNAWRSGTPTEASVLIPFILRGGKANVVLTRRTDTVKHHAGQISFPGGRREDKDSTPEATALREAQEEIGLDPGCVRILGRGPLHETATGFLITPFAGLVDPGFVPMLQEEEVAEVFEVPLAHLSILENYRVEAREWKGGLRRFYVIDFESYRIWGATARILHGLARCLDR